MMRNFKQLYACFGAFWKFTGKVNKTENIRRNSAEVYFMEVGEGDVSPMPPGSTTAPAENVYKRYLTLSIPQHAVGHIQRRLDHA